MNSSKVRLQPLFYKYLFQVKGGWMYVDLDLPQVEGYGPFIDAVAVHSLTEARTTNMEWKIVFYWSLDGKTWSGPVDLMTAIAADGNAISAGFPATSDDKLKLGLKMRYALAGRASTGDAEEKAIISAVAAFTFKS